jgi:hypothetical protein
MAKGGARAGAGRPKGSVSRRHVEILSGAVSEGQTPVEFMLSIMRDERQDEKMRAWAAEKAAPYVHPRPQPIARLIEIELPDTTTVDGIKDALAVITRATATGQIAPAEAKDLVAIVEAQRRVIETGELLERIKKLEEAQPAR